MRSKEKNLTARTMTVRNFAETLFFPSFSSSSVLLSTSVFHLLLSLVDGGKDEKMDTSPPAEDKKGEVNIRARKDQRFSSGNGFTLCVALLLQSRKTRRTA